MLYRSSAPRPASGSPCVLSATLLLVGGAGWAQAARPAAARSRPRQPAPRRAPTPEPAPEAADSPRASARAFIELATRKGDFEGAGRYLQLPPGEEARGPELARRLRAVLERHLDIDLDALSPLPEGNHAGRPARGRRHGRRGARRPRRAGPGLHRPHARRRRARYWAFSRQTVSRIDGWYDALPDRWVRDWMPERLQRYGPARPHVVAVAGAAGAPRRSPSSPGASSAA